MHDYRMPDSLFLVLKGRKLSITPETLPKVRIDRRTSVLLKEIGSQYYGLKGNNKVDVSPGPSYSKAD